MGQITQTDVGQMTEDMQRLYMPNRMVCGKAIPEALMLLLNTLETYTIEVQQEAEKQGIDKDHANVPQFAADMGNWQTRLAHYKHVLEQIPAKEWTTPVGCALAWRLVTAPLLAGFWYEILPGRNFSQEDKTRIATGQGHPETDGDWYLGAGKHTEQHPPGHSAASVPDMVTPFMLGNQVLVYGQHQQERWRLFKEDLQAPFKAIFNAIAAAADFPGRAAAAAKRLFWPLVSAAAAGVLLVGGVYYATEKRKRRKEANPHALSPGDESSEPLLVEVTEVEIVEIAVKQPTKKQLAQARMDRLDY